MSVTVDFNAIKETLLERKFLLITNIIYSKSVLFFKRGGHHSARWDAKMASTQLLQSLYAPHHQTPAPPPGTENGQTLSCTDLSGSFPYTSWVSTCMPLIQPPEIFHPIPLTFVFWWYETFWQVYPLTWSICLHYFHHLNFLFFNFADIFLSPTSIPPSLLPCYLAALKPFILLLNKHCVHFWGKIQGTDTYYVTFLRLP